ncbi:MAG: shikimate dehydrogenase [Armatimonadetes bacterium]|nr:shikimate dehydrogenase [Armatimonadota bacterium]
MSFVSKISGTTKVCGLIGNPVEHSFSPAMQNAAFSSLGLDYIYVPFLVAPADLGQALAAVRALNLVGVNVTVPHKEKVLPFLDELAPEAEIAGAVNTIVRQGGRLSGHNTDGAGFLRALAADAGFAPEGKNVLVLGAGGAARAVSAALARAGAREIRIAGRTAQKAAALAREINERVHGRARAIPWGEEDLLEVLPDVQLVVQATPVGMHPRPEDCPPFPFQGLRSGHLVCDLIYHPPLTKFLARAKAAGARIMNGLGMLLYQGVLAFELWTGVSAPVEVMRRALAEELCRRSSSE